MNRDFTNKIIQSDKKSLRKYVRDHRKALDDPCIKNESRIIENAVRDLPEYGKYQTVYLYYGCRGEVLTDVLFDSVLKDGKKAAFPRVEGDIINFYYVSSADDLTGDYRGIREPGTMCERAFDESFLLIVPGLAFDIHGNRLGYGGGFYDRFLAGCQKAEVTCVAPAFDFQLFDEIPAEPNDMPVDIIVTKNEVIRTGR